jgi:hypothetical protein
MLKKSKSKHCFIKKNLLKSNLINQLKLSSINFYQVEHNVAEILSETANLVAFFDVNFEILEFLSVVKVFTSQDFRDFLCI